MTERAKQGHFDFADPQEPDPSYVDVDKNGKVRPLERHFRIHGVIMDRVLDLLQQAHLSEKDSSEVAQLLERARNIFPRDKN